MNEIEAEEYRVLKDFYEKLNNYKIVENLKLQNRVHPYEKFGNRNDRLFESHLRESQKMEMKESVC